MCATSIRLPLLPSRLLGAAGYSAESSAEASLLLVSLAAAGPAAACLPAGEQLLLPSQPGAQGRHGVCVLPPWQAPPALRSASASQPALLDASALSSTAWGQLLSALEDACPPGATGQAGDTPTPGCSVLLLPLTFGTQLIGAMLLALPGEAAAAPTPGPGPSPPPLLHALLTQPGALEELGACVAECCLGPVLPAVSQVCASAALLSSCSSVHLLSTALTAALAGPLSSELFVDFGVRLALLPHKDAARGILFEDAAAQGSRTGMLAAPSIGSGSAYCGSPAHSRLPSHTTFHQAGAGAALPPGLGMVPGFQDHLVLEEQQLRPETTLAKASPMCSLGGAAEGVFGAAASSEALTRSTNLLAQAAAGPPKSARGGLQPSGAAEFPASPTAGAAAAASLPNQPRIAVEATSPPAVARTASAGLRLASMIVPNVPAYLQDAAQASDDVLLVARRVSSFTAIAGLWHTAPEAAAARPPAPSVVVYVTSATALPKQLLGAARAHATELLRVLLPAAARSLQGGASYQEWALLCAQAVGGGAASPAVGPLTQGWGLGLTAEPLQEGSPFTQAAGTVAAAASHTSAGPVHGAWRVAQASPPPAPSTGAASAAWAAGGGGGGGVPASPRFKVVDMGSAGPGSPLATSGSSYEPGAWGAKEAASASLPGQHPAASTLAVGRSSAAAISGTSAGAHAGAADPCSSHGALGPGPGMGAAVQPSGPLQPVTAALPLPGRPRLAGGSYAEYMQATSTGAFELTSSAGPGPSDAVIAALAAPLLALGPGGIEGAQGRQMVSTLLSEGAGSVEDTRQAQMGVMVTSLQAELHRTRTEAGPPGGRHAEDDVRALQLRKAIGSGSCAVVLLATLHALPVAVKVMAPTEGEEDEGEEDAAEPEQEQAGAQARPRTTARLRQMRHMLRGVRELAVMTSISHPNIVQVYSYCTRVVVPETPPAPGGVPRLVVVPEGEPAPGPLCTVLIMEYCDMGSLADAIDTGLFARAAKMAAAALARDPRSSSHAFHGSAPAGSSQAGVPSAQAPIGRGVAGSAGVSSTRMLGLLCADATAAGAGGPIMRAVYLTLLEVALALRHLHSMGLVHCDVKPANVLLRSSATDPRGFTAKLTDFGFVNLLKADEDETSQGDDGEGTEAPKRESSRATFRFSDRAGTVTHMAPEMFLQGSSLDSSIDVYAFGIVMWELYTGQAPYAEYAAASFQDVPYKVVKEGLRPRFASDAPQQFKLLAQACWATPPLQRPTAACIVNRLQELLDACCSAALLAIATATATSEAAGTASKQH
ncbi:hypothetical protein HYH03_007639 [Edaphochlamys debaryana]|uniref:Protein kinase domain-containing protein n=1 Tax=Edaphochlamys debaryana TaxID=47281 RepID=A0A835Y515_9CHLO|nr:hypothetical protein HYH03_007639 [Edaphochlamys debaryana]|eukprot:KAG2494286.1 hypothetical protein HYH03_007639 [Edaphochlamys debaryana]